MARLTTPHTLLHIYLMAKSAWKRALGVIGLLFGRKQLLVCFAVLVAMRKLLQRRNRTKIFHSPTAEKMKALLHHMETKPDNKGFTATPSVFYSPWWLPRIGPLETIFPEVFNHTEMNFRREVLQLPEMEKREDSTCCPDVIPEGVVSVDWLEIEGADEEETKKAPIVILVPGLTGSSDSEYLRRTAKVFHEKKFRVVAYNPRGRGGNPLVTPFLYSVGYTEDFRRAVAHICETNPETPFIFGVGYSLGSNYLAKYVAEEGENCPLSAGVCLGGFVDCMTTSNALESTFFGRIFDSLLVRMVKPLAMENATILREAPHWYDFEALKRAKTMAQFDGCMISKSFGFSSASDYYRWSSSGLILHQIRIPMLFCFAENDPICPGGKVRPDTFQASEYLMMCLTKNGGHSMDWVDNYLEPWGGKNAYLFCNANVKLFGKTEETK